MERGEERQRETGVERRKERGREFMLHRVGIQRAYEPTKHVNGCKASWHSIAHATRHLYNPSHQCNKVVTAFSKLLFRRSKIRF